MAKSKDHNAILDTLKLISNKDGISFFANLSARWADEKEYEDFADYEKVIRSKFCSFLEITKVTKRPFGMLYKVGDSIVTYAVYSKGQGRYESKVTARKAP